MVDKKDRWIATLSAGKSFMDVGGLWGTRNEKVSVALLAGARQATMADIAPLDHQLWRDFDEHCKQLGVTGYACTRLDVVEPPTDYSALVHDVVHCSGIIYHVPDPPDAGEFAQTGWRAFDPHQHGRARTHQEPQGEA